NLQALPLGMIAISFAITSFATLSELAAEPTHEKFAGEIKRVMQKVLFLIIPSTLGMLVLRKEIIGFILGYGKFSATDAAMTATVLSFLLISLFAQSLIPILSRGFYAYHNTKTPVWTALAGAIVSVGGSAILAIGLGWGIMGIAVAYSAGGILNFLLLYIFMHRKIKLDILDWRNVMKMLAASLIMALVVFIAKAWAPPDGRFVEHAGILLLLAGLGACTYFIAAHFMRIPERKFTNRSRTD
ncbi:polysaccharide biosynthesis C-terminal domain-containing protein, partial [Candidatus Peregrinibacteria bacterium]|nr:polysaccharide biosynthesis C-terminal domain-containing protein [Candidatus Peregrinibacteria bacterium]